MSKKLPFRCPRCGGDTLSYGVKSYQKVVIQADGGWDIFGCDDFGEKDVDFACWRCRHVIRINGEPIRLPEDMFKWLKAKATVEDHGPKATPDNCIHLSFTCPECGSHDLLEIMEEGEEMHTPISQVTYDSECGTVKLDYDYDGEWSDMKFRG